MTDTSQTARRLGDSGGGSRTDGQREFSGTVVGRSAEMGDCALLTIEVPAGVAPRLRPGQFVNVLSRDALSLDPLLRRPYSFFGVNSAENTMTLLVRPFGRGVNGWPAGASVTSWTSWVRSATTSR